ncbi:MAG: DUF4160 domain-containing protein, partial [Nostoc sp.]
DKTCGGKLSLSQQWQRSHFDRIKRFDYSLLNVAMPEVARFYGIVIKVFFGDHPPPHFHAIYGEYNALVSIESLEIIEGDLPSRAQKLVLEWALLYQQDMLQMWNTQEFRKLPPLK